MGENGGMEGMRRHRKVGEEGTEGKGWKVIPLEEILQDTPSLTSSFPSFSFFHHENDDECTMMAVSV